MRKTILKALICVLVSSQLVTSISIAATTKSQPTRAPTLDDFFNREGFALDVATFSKERLEKMEAEAIASLRVATSPEALADLAAVSTHAKGKELAGQVVEAHRRLIDVAAIRMTQARMEFERAYAGAEAGKAGVQGPEVGEALRNLALAVGAFKDRLSARWYDFQQSALRSYVPFRSAALDVRKFEARAGVFLDRTYGSHTAFVIDDSHFEEIKKEGQPPLLDLAKNNAMANLDFRTIRSEMGPKFDSLVKSSVSPKPPGGRQAFSPSPKSAFAPIHEQLGSRADKIRNAGKNQLHGTGVKKEGVVW